MRLSLISLLLLTTLPAFAIELQVVPLEKRVAELQEKYGKQMAKTPEKNQSDELVALTRPVASGEIAEVVLRLNYSVHCTDDSHFVAGQVFFRGRLIHVLFFEGTQVAEVGLGQSSINTDPVRVEVLSHRRCTLANFEASLDYSRVEPPRSSDQKDLDWIALQYSPFLRISSDLAESIGSSPDNSRELPMSLGYHVKQNQDLSMTLAYTLYLTNGDASSAVTARYAHAGVAPKIQRLYEVTIDRTGKSIRPSFRGALRPKTNDNFLEGALHPIIQLVDDHGVKRLEIGTTDPARLDGFQLVPRVATPNRFRDHADLQFHRIAPNRLKYPRPREWLLFEQPWMLRATDLELHQAKSLPFNPDRALVDLAAPDYLYIVAYGKLTGGKLRATLEVSTAESKLFHFTSAPDRQGAGPLGEGMWGMQSLLALPVGRDLLERLRSGGASAILTLVASEGPEAFSVKEPPRIFTFVENGRAYVGPMTDISLELSSRFVKDRAQPDLHVYSLSDSAKPSMP